MSNKRLIMRLMAGLLIASPALYVFSRNPSGDWEHGRGAYDVAYQSSLPDSMVQAALEVKAAEDQATLQDLAQTFEPLETELLWCGSLLLDYQGPDTAENVRLAAQAVDFTVVYPQTSFSFNRAVGMRSEEKGYRPGLMYSGGEVISGIGGGICILSTMLYRGALETGLKILERHPHSGPVSYASAGMDAAVSYGWADLRFGNNTKHLVLLRTEVEDDQLVVSLYGTPDPNRKVEIVAEDYEEIPYKIFEKVDESVPEGEVVVQQAARMGHRVTIVRLITEGDKLVSREVISRDTMLPRNKIVLVPPPKVETEPAIEVYDEPDELGDSVSAPDVSLPHPTDEPEADPRVHGQITLDE